MDSRITWSVNTFLGEWAYKFGLMHFDSIEDIIVISFFITVS